MSRTPLMGQLRRAFRLARLAEIKGLETDEVVGWDRQLQAAERRRALEREDARLSRRAVLQAGLGAAGAALAGCSAPPNAALSGSSLGRPVAIVGAGIAGLTVAYRLWQNGVPFRLYEANTRVGGRMHTLRGRFSRPVEIGGELIDSWHYSIRRLASELKLELRDLFAADKGLEPEVYHFGGRFVPTEEVIDGFRPIARQIDTDLIDTGLGRYTYISYKDPGKNGRFLDSLSIRDYLVRAGASPLMQELLEVAYTIEYGLEADEQSCLNLLYLIGGQGQFRVFGASDERYTVEGGNDLLPRRLAQIVGDSIQLDSALEAISQRSDGQYLLSFRQGGRSVQVVAPRVVLALPFTLLREVAIGVPLPAVKFKAIREIGYGTNSKLIAEFKERVWRTRYGASGQLFTDYPFQNQWEPKRTPEGVGGPFSNYTGGKQGLAVGKGTAEAQVAAWLGDLEKIWPGVKAAQDPRVAPVRAFWPADPWVKGSYSAYRVGQWTAFSGAEAEAVGGLHFCGEHTSVDAQGYMEGGCASGERVAEEILAVLKKGESALVST